MTLQPDRVTLVDHERLSRESFLLADHETYDPTVDRIYCEGCRRFWWTIGDLVGLYRLDAEYPLYVLCRRCSQ